MVKALANSPLLENPGEYQHGSLVFFDVFGLFVVHYPARVGFIVNSVVSFIVIVYVVRKVIRHHSLTGRKHVCVVVLPNLCGTDSRVETPLFTLYAQV